MPDFTYIGDKGRSYPSFTPPANEPTPGETYTLRSDPGDGRWKKTTGSKKKTEPEPAPAAVPNEPETPANAEES